MRHLASFAFVAFVLVACSKADSIEKLRADGFSCHLAGQGGGFAVKPGQHCFVCPDQQSMIKCSSNPIGAGCKEDPSACPKSEK